MLRFIVECHEFDFNTGMERKDIVTLDHTMPKLEAMLKKGGQGPSGFESWRLLGVEILEVKSEQG
jgi:hypothetical protein